MGRAARSRWRRGLAAALAVGFAAAALPNLVAAHPLGNFTINHYAGIRVEPERIVLDVVIDQAEIPAFQARLAFDTDGDGDVSEAETEAGRLTACDDLAGSLDLRVGGVPQSLHLLEAGLSFPPGAGGLSTMRSVCGFEAPLPAPITGITEISFSDHSFAERIGWREIVVEASGLRLSTEGTELRTSSPSGRLTVYPEDLLTQALADMEVDLTAMPGGAVLPPLDIPDADPVPGAPAGNATTPQPAPAGSEGQPVAAIPGGVGAGDLPSIFSSADLTPLVLLLSILTAAALGAGHALTPGHGKTLMAAYLVGTRGTPVHAAGLGLSVAVSHTTGILALALLVVGAQGILPPDLVVRAAPVAAAVSIVAIGGWMLLGETRRRWPSARLGAAAQSHAHGDEHDHDHHDHNNHHGHGQPGEHAHGSHSHSHAPAPGSSITWQSLFVLGLAGGLIPSASALLILLGAIAAGRPAFGFVLVVAFGLGMAAVMGGIGVALVLARGRLDRVGAATPLGRARAYLPLVASVVVLGFGLYLTVQTLTGTSTL